MDAQVTEYILERKGCPLHYWIGGQEGRPLVVLTHGACVDHHSFETQAQTVAQQYRVLMWDVRGHGKSQPMGEPFSLTLAVEDLLAIIDQMGYEQAIFVGHSNGTYIHQELAFRYPQRVKAMVIADGTCITWPRSAFQDWIIRVSGDMMALFPYETLKKAGLSMVSANPAVQDYTYKAYSQIPKESYIKIWKGMSYSLHGEPDYRITQPLLLMHGDDDRMGDCKQIAPLWAKQSPNCEYVVIPNARHFAILDNELFFTEKLMHFLEKWAE